MSVTRTFTVTVNPTVDPPVITQIDAQTILEDGTITLPLSATDVDEGDTKTFSVGQVENLTTAISVDGNNVILTPDADFFGESSVSVTVTDGDDLTDVTNFTLTTTPVNDAPVITSFSDIVSMDENGSVLVLLSASDVDDTDLANDSIMQYNSTSGKFEFTNELDGGTV